MWSVLNITWGGSYPIALGATAAAVLLRWLLAPVLADHMPLVTLYGAVAIAVWIGGWRPALLAAALGYLACGYLFIEPRGSFAPVAARNLAGLIAYLITCSIIIGFGEVMRTALRRLNDALEYAENIVETVREPMLVLDARLRVRTANRSFYRAFRVTREDTEGRLVYDLGNGPWDIPKLRSLLEEVLPENTTFDDFEVTHEFPALGRRVMLVNARRMYRAGNHTELILLAIEDVTERRRMEDERRELETRFTSLVKNIRDHSIFSLDPQGRITSWNREAEKILGYSEAEALGQHFSVIFTPEDRQNGLPEWELRTAREEGRAEDEHWHVRKGGERFWALGIVTPTQDASGAHTGYSKILRDMTDRKQAEVALRESEARHRRLSEQLNLVTDTMSAPVTRCSRDLHYSWVSRPYAEWLGRSPDDIVGRSIIDVLGREAFEKLLPYFNAVLSGQEVRYQEEAEFLGLGRRWISAAYTPTFDAAGVPDGWVAVVIDIDKRKRMEQALRERAAQQAAVADLGQKTLVERDLHALMNEAVHSVAAVLGVEYCKVLELLPGGRELLLRAGLGWREGVVGHATVGAGQGSQAGYTLLSTEPVVVDDLLSETRFHVPPLLREHGVVSGMSCRIAGPAGQPFGVLGAHTSRPRHFTSEDVYFLEAVANVLGGVIQRRYFEEGFQQSEARHRAVVNTAVDAIITIDEQGLMQTVNPAAERLFGYAAEEMIGQNVKLLMPSPYREEHDDYLARYLATGEKRIIGIGREVVGLRKDGTTFPMDLAVAEACLGEQRLFVGFIRDITERLQTEERFRLVVESAPNAMVMVNEAGNIVLVNSQAERYFGYRREELVGEPVEILVPERFRGIHPGYRASFFASPSVRPMGAGRDLYGRRKDGSEFPVEIGLTPIQTTEGFLVLSAIVDISERKHAEEALRSSHARLAADLETMAKLQGLSNRLVHDDNPEALLPSVLEAAIAVNSADMGNIQLLDRDSGELKIVASRGFEPPFLEFFNAVGQGQAACGTAMQNRKRVVIEDITVSPIFAGTPALDVMLTAGVRAVQSTPLVSRSGRLVGMLSTHYRKPHVPAENELQVMDLLARQAADWIERLEAEEERHRNHDGLKKLVTELQAKNEEIRATTQQLWQAAKLASVGELAASIAHELNNPLATMSLRIESLLDDVPQEDPNRRTLEIVQQETRRMSTLVANLLQFSRRGHEQISTVDIRQELASTVELVYHHFKKRQIAIVQKLAPDTPIIYADRQKLRQVFLNLFTNASDAMSQGGTLTLRSRADALAGGKAAVRIEIADRGMGIPAEHLEKVFDPYFTTKEEDQGTGLGLAICRRIVEEHHGFIRVDSELGKGTTLIIVLPVRDDRNGDGAWADPTETEVQSNVKE